MAGRVASTLKRRATAWAGMLTRIAKEFAPEHLKGVISSRVTERGDNAYTIILSAKKRPGLPYEGSMDAAAQEYGSGQHDRNNKHYIDIYPRKGKYLAFYWEALENDIESGLQDRKEIPLRFLPDGRVLLQHVEHPGIRPYKGIGYLRPAIMELRAKGTKELREDIRQAILGDMAESFRNANKR